MRAVVIGMVLGLVALIMPPSSTAEVLTSTEVDSLTFPHTLLSIKDDDPSSQTLHFFLNGGADLHIKQENIDRVVDETEMPGRVYITFVAKPTSSAELEKFRAWDFKQAREESEPPTVDGTSTRPEVRILLTFPNNAEENEYVMGFTDREDDGTIYRPPSPTAKLPPLKEGDNVIETR